MLLSHLGDFNYQEDTKTLYFYRDCGIGSNLSVLLYVLMELKTLNIHPEKIITKLKEYKNLDLYSEDLFIDKDKLEIWKAYDRKAVENFLRNIKLTNFGLGENKDQINLEIVLLIIDVYLNFSQKVINEKDRIIKKYNIDKNYDFLFWRRTDKIVEINNEYPSLEYALSLFTNKNNIITQTDDGELKTKLEAFKKIILLKELPISNAPGFAVHHMCKNLTPEQYKRNFNHDFKDHITMILAIMLLASKSNFFVGYPGNLSVYTAFLRKNFNNVFICKDINFFY